MNKKGLVFGTIGSLIGMGVAAWMDRKRKLVVENIDDTEIEAEVVDVPAEEVTEVNEEVTEG